MINDACFEQYNLKEWKLVYLQLLSKSTAAPDLLDIDFFNDLQIYLQGKAETIGLDPLHHDTWINWLNNTKNCGVSAQLVDRIPENIKGAILPEIQDTI
ncbi:uncharacterized protein METZ01_LOCUS455906 [marine metagenome]|uniref:Uncharacterized protein n=1 Tax=marine metagenome TaxID=408172 RepID=A0A383A5J0_9ZZZZ